MPLKLKKILIKVIRGDEIKWVHFCYVSEELFYEFFKVAKCERSEFGTFLSMWAQGDFSVKLKMSQYDDIQTLKYLVNKKFISEYSELYDLNQEENPRIDGWLRMWVSQHMRVEIAARKGDYE